jgi:hypothetical protein
MEIPSTFSAPRGFRFGSLKTKAQAAYQHYSGSLRSEAATMVAENRATIATRLRDFAKKLGRR